jgi:PAS domain S-box-containing protein
VLVEDFQQDPRVNPLSRAALPSVTGMLAVPLIAEGVPVGVMLLRWTDRRRLEPFDVDLAEALGQHAALAIRRARLIDTLRSTDERYRRVADAARATVWQWDPASEALTWEGAGPAAFGYDGEAADTIGWWHERVHPADRDRLWRSARRALEGGLGGYDLEYRFRLASGVYAWCRTVAWVVRASDSATRVFGIMMDVTALRSAEAERDQLADALSRVEERERVAMDLHDGAVQQLFGARVALAAAARSAVADPAGAIGRAEEILGAVDASLRQYMERLLTPADEGNLTETIATAVGALAEATETEITTHVDPAAAAGLSATTVVHIGYIIREAVSNALRHARARRVAIEVRRSRGQMVLTVRDDGVGFRPAATKRGRGLTNMRRRATLLAARLAISSRPDAGTTIRLTLREQAAGMGPTH